MKCQIYFVKNPHIKPGPSYGGEGREKHTGDCIKTLQVKATLPRIVGFAIPVPVAYGTQFPLSLAQGYVHRCPQQLLYVYFLSAVIFTYKPTKAGPCIRNDLS
jgi:hypothetical protein